MNGKSNPDSGWAGNKEEKSLISHYQRLILWNSPHSLHAEPTSSEKQGNATYHVEKDEGDALFKVWAHEPLKGLFMPLLAWIITSGFPVMRCGWYIGPHLLLLRFHLARSSKSPINKKTHAFNGIANDCSLKPAAKTAWPIWWKWNSGSHFASKLAWWNFTLVLDVKLINSLHCQFLCTIVIDIL